MSKVITILISLAVVIFLAWVVFGGNLKTASAPAPINTSPNQQNNMLPAVNPRNPVVILHTNLGDISLELLADKAPKTVDNFLKLAKAGFYDGTLFHRVIKDFMIQGGDPLTKTQPKNWAIHGTGGPGYSFDDEINDVKLVRGVLAMANAGPGTNGSQFFIVTTPLVDWLNTREPGVGWHTPFGRIISGMDVIDKIEAVKVNEKAHPLTDVTIETVEIK